MNEVGPNEQGDSLTNPVRFPPLPRVPLVDNGNGEESQYSSEFILKRRTSPEIHKMSEAGPNEQDDSLTNSVRCPAFPRVPVFDNGDSEESYIP